MEVMPSAPEPAAPKSSFMSSLDFGLNSSASSGAILRNGGGPSSSILDPSPGTSNSGSTTGTTGPSIKGRNTAATLIKPMARASKAAALQIIRRVDDAGLSGADSDGDPLVPNANRNPVKVAQRLPKAPPLDFSTIRTSAPRHPNPIPRPPDRPRIFGLEHCPVYHPTVDEFAKPMEYIEKISKEAREYGICKVVPPEGWRPPFALNTETFHFKTRLQRLNMMEASARASINFLEQLYLFHRQQGSMGISVPTVSGKPLDLWRLKKEVAVHGGYVAVTLNRKWQLVARALGYANFADPDLLGELKHSYFKIVFPFDRFVARVKQQGGTPPPDPNDISDKVPATTGLSSANVKLDGGGSAVLDEMTAGDNPRTASDAKANAATTAQPIASTSALPYDDTPGEACEICKMDYDPDKIVLCDDCDKGFHLGCLDPPLASVPQSQFFCDACLLMNGAEYGFEEGQEHTMHTFRTRADNFKRQWLQQHPLPEADRVRFAHGATNPSEVLAEQVAIEDHFEREFWRLVESPTETIEVEYGADVNSTRDGGGLPSLEVHPTDPYSRDGWNLNNLPILAGSLLRYIKSDISGMTIPWMYVGMVFSTFAWHMEDHFTYSINYHHWGDTKTWYGVPGDDNEKLEEAMRKTAPELFEQQPDLMFQLVTLMSPGRLREHGVRVYACDQRPNEFVITFPRAYHSGFNHGFNFNEAVNFALPDWLANGLRCVERYRDIKKNPVFSHDELLTTISVHEKNPRSSRWLYPHFKEMVERELRRRAQVRAELPDAVEIVDGNELEEEEYQCETCRTMCYLSQVLSSTKEVSCPEHFRDLPAGPKIYRLKYSDDELQAMMARVKSRSEKAPREGSSAAAAAGGGSSTTGKAKPAVASAATNGETLASPGAAGERLSGRKRKPSNALLEAAGEVLPSAAERMRIELGNSDDDSTTTADTSEAAAAARQQEDKAVKKAKVDTSTTFAPGSSSAPAAAAAPSSVPSSSSITLNAMEPSLESSARVSGPSGSGHNGVSSNAIPSSSMTSGGTTTTTMRVPIPTTVTPTGPMGPMGAFGGGFWPPYALPSSSRPPHGPINSHALSPPSSAATAAAVAAPSSNRIIGVKRSSPPHHATMAAAVSSSTFTFPPLTSPVAVTGLSYGGVQPSPSVTSAAAAPRPFEAHEPPIQLGHAAHEDVRDAQPPNEERQT